MGDLSPEGAGDLSPEGAGDLSPQEREVYAGRYGRPEPAGTGDLSPERRQVYAGRYGELGPGWAREGGRSGFRQDRRPGRKGETPEGAGLHERPAEPHPRAE
ncbi:hypothetical protein Shyhy02_10480 [Streptomyces hygroscopicus subsp. hygroscopicus]|nr:hypothetical protein Shyhy02_10480 [Streptomyces hygroscopicus subsp. hygroscopicus]